MASRLTVNVDGADLAGAFEGLVFSNVDPGGYETATLEPHGIDTPRIGGALTIRLGGQVVWSGVVTEPGQAARNGRSNKSVVGSGHGIGLRSSPYREVYIDRDLARWRSPSTMRQSQLRGASYKEFSGQALWDTTRGIPGLQLDISDGSWVAPVLPDAELWYDANGIPLGAIYIESYNVSPSTIVDTDGLWSVITSLASDDGVLTASGPTGQFDDSADLKDAGGVYPKVVLLLPTTLNRTFARVRLRYTGTPAGSSANPGYSWLFASIGIYGTHGLAPRGTSPGGFYPHDIVLDALARSGGGIAAGRIGDSSSFIVPHLVYDAPTSAEQVISDMAQLMGWSWGVWDSGSMLETTPALDFAPPSPVATAVVDRADCAEFDAPQIIYDRLYNIAEVRYRQPSGAQGIVEVETANELLAEAGVARRVLELDMGLGSAEAARVFGRLALLLAARAARGGGSATVPDTVMAASGPMPAALLKAGRDRLRIRDLRESGMLTESDTRRFDTFHVRRVETTLARGGHISTRVEFDGGADLLEVLQARLTMASVMAGVG